MNRQRFMLRAAPGVMMVLGAVAARGDIIVTGDDKWAAAETYQLDALSNFVGTPQFNRIEVMNDGLDFSASASTNYNDLGFIATATGTWNHTYNPSNPGIGNAFLGAQMSGSAVTQSISGGQWVDINTAMGSSVVDFTVTSDTAWTFSADFLATTSGFGLALYGFTLTNVVTQEVYGQAFNIASGGGSINDSVRLSGTIPAGQYFYQAYVFASQYFDTQAGEGAASIEVTNAVFTVPTPSTAAILALGGLALRRRRSS